MAGQIGGRRRAISLILYEGRFCVMGKSFALGWPIRVWRWPVVGGALALCAGLAAGCAWAMPGLGGDVLHRVAIPGVGWFANPGQVRIQQNFTIRITPGRMPPGPPAPPPNLVVEMEQDTRPVRLEERRFGNCLPAGSVIGVQSAEGNRLLLFLRDTRVVSALLEKSCRAMDYYSGFYVERNADGQICVERDKLHARSGANCKIHELRALVEVSGRRFP